MRFWLGFLCCLPLLGCTPGLTPGQFACDDTRGCPDSWFCHSDGRCYPAPEDGGVQDGAVDAGTDAGEPCGGSCDDGNECTMDLCDLVRDVCVHTPTKEGMACGDGATGLCCSGVCADTSSDATACGPSCAVCTANEGCAAGACACIGSFRDCDSEPGCETNINSDPEHCGGCGNDCGGQSCIFDGTQASCGSCNSANDCNDGLGCTADMCDGVDCESTIIEDACVIDGACYAAGDRNPDNECLGCDPEQDQEEWSDLDGARCDGSLCLEDQACAAGVCTGGTSTCDDGIACNGEETCFEFNGSCRRGEPQCPGWDRTPGQNCGSKELLLCQPCGGNNQPCCISYGALRPPCTNILQRFCPLSGVCSGGTFDL